MKHSISFWTDQLKQLSNKVSIPQAYKRHRRRKTTALLNARARLKEESSITPSKWSLSNVQEDNHAKHENVFQKSLKKVIPKSWHQVSPPRIDLSQKVAT